MNMMAILSLVAGLIPIATKIGQLWQSSAGFSAIAQAIASSSAITELESVGAAIWPAADKAVQKVLAAIHLAAPQSTQWAQTSLNTIQAAGVISFGAPLVVDGVFGPKTFAAVVVLQAKVGLKPTGAVADAEYKAINALLEGKTA
jgi:peptidoglycan hydrolase-like protein with peptidoglycan-binding domain